MIFRLSQRFSIKYSFSNQSSLEQLYTHHDISQRVRALQDINLDRLDGLQLPHRPILLPPYIKIGTAKNLVDFHRERNTKQNLITLHALAFIEFNAFLAYSDTLIRFRSFDQISKVDAISQFQKQIKKIAIDQGSHCLMLIKRIEQLGHSFGQFPVIQNLSNIVNITTSSLIERLALVCIVHQGRGTKSIQKLISKMYYCQDIESAKLLRKIQVEQIEHLKVGLKWFKYFCDQKINKMGSTFSSEIQKQKYEDILKQINLKYKTKIRLSDLCPPEKEIKSNLIK